MPGGKSWARRIEGYDTVRTIYLGDQSAFNAPSSRLGNSVGRCLGEELHLVTREVDWRFFDGTGIPQSPAVELAEIFRLSSDGSRLEYELTVTAPDTFTEPVHLDKQWMWRPAEEVRPYECTPRQ